MSWSTLSFSDVVADETGGNTKTLQSDFQPEGAYPIVDQGKELIAGYTNDDQRLCKSQTPVIIFGDHTKCLKFIDFPFCLGADGTKVLRPKIEIDEKFLFYYLQTIHIPDAGYSRHFKYLKQSKILLPPLDEQKRIAAILHQADALRRLRQRALDNLNTLGQSIFYEMFGDPATNPMQHKMGVLGDVVHSASDGPHVSPEYTEDGIPFLSTRHVRSGKITWNDLKYISNEEAERQWKKCKPKRGDILYTKGGTTGIAALVDTDVDFAVWVHVALLTPKLETVDSTWLVFMLKSEFCYRQSQRFTHGIANRDLGLRRMVKINLFIPEIEKQKEFVRIISVLNKTIGHTSDALVRDNDLFASLQQRAFRGEL